MRKTLNILILLAVFSCASPLCHGSYYYVNVDSEFGGPLELSIIDTTIILAVNEDRWTVEFEAENTGAIDLSDVGLAWLFNYDSDNNPFIYDNSQHLWTRSSAWIRVYGVQNQNDLLSMSRDVTNLPLVSDRGATLSATDEIPVLWLGDIPAFQSVQFTAHLVTSMDAQYPDGPAVYGEPFLVSTTIPEPATLLLLGTGGLFLRNRRK